MQNVPKKKHAVRRHSRILLLIFAVALVAGWVFGINPLTVLGLLSGGGEAPVLQVVIQGAPSQPTTTVRPNANGGGQLLIAFKAAVKQDLMGEMASGGAFGAMVNAITGTQRPTAART